VHVNQAITLRACSKSSAASLSMNWSAFEERSNCFCIFTLGEPAEASARSGEHGRHACTGGGGVQRQKRLHAEAWLDGRPKRGTRPITTAPVVHYSVSCLLYRGAAEERRAGPYLRRRGGAANARRRDGRVVAEETEDLAVAGAARRREADERSSDLAAAAAAIVVGRRGGDGVFRSACAAGGNSVIVMMDWSGESSVWA